MVVGFSSFWLLSKKARFWFAFGYLDECVVIAKLTYDSSAWWGFASVADRQRLEAFLRWSHRCRFIPPNLPSFSELCSTAVNELFQRVINDNKHVLYGLLPPTSVASQNYNLRHRKRSLQLPSKTHHFMDSNYSTYALPWLLLIKSTPPRLAQLGLLTL